MTQVLLTILLPVSHVGREGSKNHKQATEDHNAPSLVVHDYASFSKIGIIIAATPKKTTSRA
jgi:hypothetical protein